VKKLISIGIVLALLVTFLMPVAVGAQCPGTVGATSEYCANCGVQGPCPAPVPTNCGTDTVGGGLLWALLGTTYIMGRAVGDVTEHLAGTLGCYVDELATPTFGVIGAITTGIAGLLNGLGTLIGYTDILGPIATMLTDIADQIKAFVT
jgi:hypothetical protein